MLKFKGQTTQKVTISGKFISTEFKLFALGNSDYICNWECTKPGLNKDLITAKKLVSVSFSNFTQSTLLNPTQSVIIRLIRYLTHFIEQKRLNFCLFLDNLFVF